MSKIIKGVGVALAAAAMVGVGVGTASAGTVHHDASPHPAKATQVVYTKGFKVTADTLPQGTYLVVDTIAGNNIGGLDSGPAMGSTLKSNGSQDYEVTWFAAKDNDIKVTYKLWMNNGAWPPYDTGKSIVLDFDVNMWDTATLTVGTQNGVEGLPGSGDPDPVNLYVPTA